MDFVRFEVIFGLWGFTMGLVATACHRGGSGSISRLSVWNLWWKSLY